jgi:hypothetical protein
MTEKEVFLKALRRMVDKTPSWLAAELEEESSASLLLTLGSFGVCRAIRFDFALDGELYGIVFM